MERAAEGRADADFYHPDRIRRSQLESFVKGIKYQSDNGILGDARGGNAAAGQRLQAISFRHKAAEIRAEIERLDS